MGFLDKETFICVDCEMTGLEIKKDHLIEIAVVLFEGDTTLNSYETLVKPPIPISKESIKIHNITDDMVKDKPHIRKVLPEVLSLIGKKIIVGHGVTFDIDMINEAAQNYGIDCTLKKNAVIDTLRLARLYGNSPTNSLQALRKHFNIELEGPHRAMADVIVNIQIFRLLTKKFKTTEQILERLKKPILMKNMPLGKHKGRSFKEVPLRYLLWARHQDFDMDLLFSINTEIKKRQKGEHFSQSSNPFSQL